MLGGERAIGLRATPSWRRTLGLLVGAAAVAMSLAVASPAFAAYECTQANSACGFGGIAASSSVIRNYGITSYGMFMHNQNSATCKYKQVVFKNNPGQAWPETTDYTCNVQVWSTWFTGAAYANGVPAASGQHRFINPNGGAISVNGGGLY